MMRPSASTRMRVHSDITNSMLCSMTTNVAPVSLLIACRRSFRLASIDRLTPPAGSSSSTRRGPGHERHGAIEQLLLAVGEAAGLLVGEVAEAEEVDHALGRGRQARIAAAEQAAEHVPFVLLAGEDQVFAHGQFGEHLQQLEGAADAEAIELRGAQARDRAAIDGDGALGRVELAEDAVEQRRLARAVRADQAEDLAAADVEGDAVDGFDAAEVLLDAADFEDGRVRVAVAGVRLMVWSPRSWRLSPRRKRPAPCPRSSAGSARTVRRCPSA